MMRKSLETKEQLYEPLNKADEHRQSSPITPTTNNSIVHVVLVLIQLCFSGWHIMGSVALKDGADPFTFALYRELAATCLMFGFVSYRKANISIHKEDWPRFFYIGVCSFVNVVGTVVALDYITATRYSIMQPSIPIWATLVSAVLRIEALTPLKVLGIALAVGGAITVELWRSDGDEEGQNAIIGTLIVVVQCFAMSNIIVFQRPLLLKYDTSVITFVYYGIGSLVTVLVCIGWAQRFVLSDFYFNNEVMPWIALIYAAIFATLFPYNAYSWAGTKASPSIITVYSTLQPVGTALLSLIFFKEIITFPEIVGGVLVAAGLVVTVYARQREQVKLAVEEGSDSSDACDRDNTFDSNTMTKV